MSGGLVRETTPQTGKRITTFEEFCAGQQGFILRYSRSPYENGIVELRALSNLGGPYDGAADNCEHDSSYAQTGVASSPTVNGLLVLAGVGVFVGIARAMNDN